MFLFFCVYIGTCIVAISTYIISCKRGNVICIRKSCNMIYGLLFFLVFVLYSILPSLSLHSMLLEAYTYTYIRVSNNRATVLGLQLVLHKIYTILFIMWGHKILLWCINKWFYRDRNKYFQVIFVVVLYNCSRCNESRDVCSVRYKQGLQCKFFKPLSFITRVRNGIILREVLLLFSKTGLLHSIN